MLHTFRIGCVTAHTSVRLRLQIPAGEMLHYLLTDISSVCVLYLYIIFYNNILID